MQVSLIRFHSMVVIVNEPFFSEAPPSCVFGILTILKTDHLTDQAERGIWSTWAMKFQRGVLYGSYFTD